MKSFAAAALILACACATRPSALNVRPEPLQYSPAMSSTPGIGLRTVFVPPAGTAVDYHWSADYGYFVSWNAPSFKVVPRGADLVATEGTLYWSYDAKRAFERKPVVTIAVEARDAESGRVLARKKLKLDWDGDTARVREED
jgi:hypothetical protein